MLILDIIAFIFSLGGLLFCAKLYFLIRAKPFILTILALLYTTILRMLVLTKDFGWVTFSMSDLMSAFVVFYILNCFGIIGLYYGFKKFLRKNHII